MHSHLVQLLFVCSKDLRHIFIIIINYYYYARVVYLSHVPPCQEQHAHRKRRVKET